MKTIIIGAGGHARVVYDILSYDKNIEVVAFIDHEKRGVDEKIMGVQVLGGHEVIPDLIAGGTKGFIIAIGDNKIRAQYYKELSEMGLEPINAIHPTVVMAQNAYIGKGNVMAMGAIIATGASIGDNCIINSGAIIEHEDRIGSHVHIGPGCSIAGRVTIHNDSFVGIGSVIAPYTLIGRNTIIGAGSVVLKDIPENSVAVGAPAVVKKKNLS